MRKVYYIYNPQTQTYDRIYPTFRQRVMGTLRRLFIGMGFGAGSFILLFILFGTPSEKELRKENSQLRAQYQVLSHRMDEALGVLQDIQQRDDNLYRVMFQADPIPTPIRQAGYSGTNRYEHLLKMADADLVIVMDESNLRLLERITGCQSSGKVHKLLEYAGQNSDVADPWYTGNFEQAFSDILRGCQALLKSYPETKY